MLIKHITKKVFDVFFNTGWEHWARFELVKNDKYERKLVQIKGDPAPHGVVTYVNRIYGAK